MHGQTAKTLRRELSARLPHVLCNLPAPSARVHKTLPSKGSGDDRKDDRSVKHIDTASDLFPLSLPADGKASNPLF